MNRIALATFILLLSCSADPQKLAQKYKEATELYQQRRTQDALKLYQEILNEDQDFPGAMLMAGKIHYFENRLPEAERHFRDLVNRDHGHPDGTYWLAKTIAVQQARRSEAIELLDQLLKRDATHSEAWILKGSLLEEKKDLTGALTCYRAAVAIEPSLANAHMRLANLLDLAKLPDQAKRSRERARLLSSPSQ